MSLNLFCEVLVTAKISKFPVGKYRYSFCDRIFHQHTNDFTGNHDRNIKISASSLTHKKSTPHTHKLFTLQLSGVESTTVLLPVAGKQSPLRLGTPVFSGKNKSEIARRQRNQKKVAMVR